jgi:hypothetical protein
MSFLIAVAVAIPDVLVRSLFQESCLSASDRSFVPSFLLLE